MLTFYEDLADGIFKIRILTSNFISSYHHLKIVVCKDKYTGKLDKHNTYRNSKKYSYSF